MSLTLPSLAVVLLLGTIDAPSLDVMEQPSALHIRLTWASPASPAASVNDRELLVRFDRPLELPEALELPRRAPAWIENAVVGYDTLLLRAARPVTFVVSSDGNTTTIELRPAAEPAPEPAAGQLDGERRLELLRAELLVIERELGRASQLLRRLAAEHPDPVPALLLLAQVDAQRGRWRAADRALAQVRRLQPTHEALVIQRADLRRDHAGRVRADAEWRDVEGAQTERIARASGHALLGGVRLGFAAERNETVYDGARFERDRAELYVQADSLRGTTLRVAGFGTRVAAGGGLSLAHPDDAGRTQVQVEYRRPFWEILQGITGHGVRDRAEVRREQRLGSRLVVRAGAAGNRYGLDGAADVARSLAGDGGAALTLVRRNPTIALEYAVDVEAWQTLQPDTLPVADREVHAASLAGDLRFSRAAALSAFGGYAWDRLGGQGPFSGGRLTIDGAGALGMDVWVERRLHTLATTERVTRAGVHLLWRWQ